MSWTEIVVDLPQGPVRAQSRGEGPLLLWTHGIFHPIDVDDHSSIARVFDGLQGFRLVRYDTRGQGRTPAGPTVEAHRWRDLADELLALASALGARRFVAGGISMGAAVSLHAAVAAPERVAGLVLLAPPTGWATRPPQLDSYRALAALDGPEAIAAQVRADLERAFAPGEVPAPLRVMAEKLRHADPTALSRVLLAAADSDLPARAQVERLPTPAVVIPWDNDEGHPLSTAREIAQALPGARLAVVAGVDDVDGIVRAASPLLASCRAALGAPT